jgi:hypothetical protein
MRTADALVAETAAAVVAFAIEEAGNEAAIGDMMRKDNTSRWKDINNGLQRVYDILYDNRSDRNRRRRSSLRTLHTIFELQAVT